MAKITESGMHTDEFGQMVLITQGLAGYTFVANKKILFRLFLDVSALCCPTVIATVTYKILFLSITKTFIIPSSALLIEDAAPFGPSIGVLFTGDAFPYLGSNVRYQVDFRVYGGSSTIPHFRTPEMQFQMPERLRLLIHNLVGTAPWGNTITPNFGWLVDMFQALERFSNMLPVRDGLKFGLTHADAGLCFIYGDNIDTWPQPTPTPAEMVQLILSETEQINASGTNERVDATVGFRMRDAAKFPPPGGEGPGGKAISYDSPPGKGLALVVGGNWNGKEMTGSIIGQEVGHLFGLEPKESPHFEDPLDGLHSKDPVLTDPFAFDFYLLKHYQPGPGAFLGDVMNGLGGGVWQGRDMSLYNAFDWEYLRKKLVRLPGVAARSIVEAKRPSKAHERKVVAALDTMFADENEIDVRNPQKTLPSRDGYTWHWTSRGFQPVKEDEKKTGPRLSPHAEAIRTSLEGLGIRQAYAPVADRPLRAVITPNANAYMSLHRKEFSVF
jgi:hypothetical protein